MIVTISKFNDSQKDYKAISGRILIVEDEKYLRILLVRTLEKFGLDVEQAENGAIALEKIKTIQFDVVITDLKMPVMGGEKLIEEMLKIGCLDKTKVLVVTGGLEENIFVHNEVLKDIEIGIINKPFSKKIIYKRLKNVL